MRVYLAAAWSRKDEIKKIADELIELGVDVQAQWLSEPAIFPADVSKAFFLQQRAEIDVNDILQCDLLVRFSDDLTGQTVPASLATGSRMFEMGLAWQAGKEIIVVGGYQCVFDYLEGVIHVRDVEDLKMQLLAPVLSDEPEY